ncbi:HtaA domain-containing protein [Streptomyces sp. NBC_00825]|uniref:HtaA domain-containing protein n=1 Tax=unclassified Streptomyces TaxID=2593676 RepID=UPI002ED68968|nr:HtaA domain-containing protein [Streptomyces sp. NBC_00826]WTH93111.1 HtaA domain-containing protein [Streptomyces sp. NBC_00825]WTI01843.1 HtaA domain-containing protein [Streptomyces sp. NBC_00822]
MAANRRPIALTAAVATAAALGATVFALPTLADDGAAAGGRAAAAPKLELTDGTLEWGVKESFRKYLASSFSGGKITVKDGATQAAGNGAFTFTDGKGIYDTATHGTDTAFRGGVNFYAHGGVLDITLSDVKLATTGTGGAITVDVTTPKGTEDDVEFASLDLSAVKPGKGEGGAMLFKDIPATLTKAGSEAFDGQYKEGDALDPATLSVKAVAEPSEKPSEKPSEEPGTEPSGEPSAKPSTEPSAGPSTKPTPPASPSTPSTTGPTGTEAGEIHDGTLDWGVKKSFRSYVTGPIANGKVETTAGATASGDGYRFPDATGHFDAAKQTLNAEFHGKVRFLGHEEKGAYTLDLSLSGMEVQVNGTKGKLIADVSTKDRKTKKVSTYTGLAVADLKLPKGQLAAKGGVVNLSAVPATLTADGTKAFGGMYPAGEQLDALTVAVALDKDAELPGSAGGSGSAGGTGSAGGSATAGGGSIGGGGSVGGGSVGGAGSLAATGSDIPAGALFAASGVVVAAGAGVVIAARRRRTV